MIQNLKLEQAVLGCMILDYECAKQYDLLAEEDFQNGINQQIFLAVKVLVQQNQVPDYTTVYNQLNQKLDMTYLIDLSESMASTVNFKTYVEQLKHVTMLNNYYKAGQLISQRAMNDDSVAEFAESQILEISQANSTGEFTSARDLALATLEDLETQYQSDGLTGLSTGYPDLDKMTDGLKKSDYIIIAGRPSMGKTALALNIVENVALKQNQAVAIFSLEMSKKQLMTRMVLSQAFVDISRIKNKQLNDNDWKTLALAAQRIYDSKIFINDECGLTIGDMKSLCRKLKLQHGLDLIVIDYLQLMNGGEGESRQQQISNISRNCKMLAKEIDCPVIALSQLSRAPEIRTNHRPIMSDLRESGSLEQDGDLIMFLYRDEYYNPDTDKKEIGELIIGKQRNGPTGTVELVWLKQFTKFVNLSRMENLKN